MTFHPTLTTQTAAARIGGLIADAARHRAGTAVPAPDVDPLADVVIAALTASDHDELSALAELDGRPVPGGLVMVARRGGVLVAAAGSGGGAVADPFRATAAVVEVLRTVAAARARAAAPTRGRGTARRFAAPTSSRA